MRREILRQPLAPALAILLVWAPLPFASVTPGWAALLRAAAFLLVAVAPWLPGGGSPHSAGARGVPRALVAVGVLGFVQSLAWPSGIVEGVSPEHARFARENAALVGEPPPARAPLSLAPEASRASALAWLLPAAGFALAARCCADRRSRRLLGAAIVASALFQALYGAPLRLAGSSAIWGVETPLAALRLRGTFVNPNHLALYLETAIAVALGWTYWAWRRGAREPTAERRLAKVGPPAIVASALVAALAFTGSRAGLVAAAGGAGVALLLAARGRASRLAVAAAAALALLAAAGALIGFDEAYGRLFATSADDASGRARLAAAADTLSLARRFPLTGAGLGAFATAFPLVQRRGLDGFWRHAHDDWAELAATTGVVGLALVAGGLVALGGALARSWRRNERSEERAAVLAATAAVVAVAIHSVFDFGLTLPANAWTLAVLAGLGISAQPPEKGAERRAEPLAEVQAAADPASNPSAKTG